VSRPPSGAADKPAGQTSNPSIETPQAEHPHVVAAQAPLTGHGAAKRSCSSDDGDFHERQPGAPAQVMSSRQLVKSAASAAVLPGPLSGLGSGWPVGGVAGGRRASGPHRAAVGGRRCAQMNALIVAPALHPSPAPKGPALISPEAVTTAAPSLSNPDRQTVCGRPQSARAVPGTY
jgi:hypothetical protein